MDDLLHAVALVGLGIVGLGCNRETRAAQAAPAAPVVVMIPPPSATVTTGEPAPAPAGPRREARLTWTFGPILRESEAGPQREVAVLFQVGADVHRFPVRRWFGHLVPSDQSVCLPPTAKKEDVVSFVELSTMGETHLVARRLRPNSIEVSFSVEADDEPAKTHGILARIPVPPDLPVVEEVLVVRSDGTEGRLDCSATSAQ